MKSVILVCCHKQDEVYEDKIYSPIQVGCDCNNIDLGYLKDNVGDNISKKNLNYSELTAQYWGWKNLNCDYIGLCHYRRYFKTLYTENLIINDLNKYDIILAKPLYNKESVETKFERCLSLEDMYIFLNVVNKIYPEYMPTIYDYLSNNIEFPFNMFITSKRTFDIFAKWQFNILFECENYIRLSGYSRMKRIYGYFSEILLPVYCIHNNLKIKHEAVVSMIGDKESLYSSGLKSKLKVGIFQMFNKNKISSIKSYFDVSVINGLKNDEIVF